MSDPQMPALPRLFTIAEVADALQQTERYVAERCRRREWPHGRFARGQVRFTADDFAAVLALCHVAPDMPPAPRLSFAPRSRHRRLNYRS